MMSRTAHTFSPHVTSFGLYNITNDDPVGKQFHKAAQYAKTIQFNLHTKKTKKKILRFFT